jgi:hypothetical protein
MFETKDSREENTKLLLTKLFNQVEARNLKEISDDYCYTNGTYKAMTDSLLATRNELIEVLRRVR